MKKLVLSLLILVVLVTFLACDNPDGGDGGDSLWTEIDSDSPLFTAFNDTIASSNWTSLGISGAETAYLGGGKNVTVNIVSYEDDIYSYTSSLLYYDGTDWSGQDYPGYNEGNLMGYAGIAYVDADTAIMFGGNSAASGSDPVASNQLAVYSAPDLTGVTPITDATGTTPSARFNPIVEYAGSNKVLVIFGDDGSSIASDAGLYNHTSNEWETVADFTGTPRIGAMSAYAGGNKVVLFGGVDNSDNTLSDTWIYDSSANTWSELQPATNPGGLVYASMKYIGSNDNGGVIVLFGGATSIDADGNAEISDKTWVLSNDGTDWNWVEYDTPSSLDGRLDSIAYSSETGKLRIVGGRFDLKKFEDNPDEFETDEWEFDYTGEETLTNELD